ncbi:MAG: N-acetyltransferase [Bacilli bacterium]|jgi:predicted N-acetyltransferase YhbS|nr:N-acetyltransferase [Bacilli bacterium]
MGELTIRHESEDDFFESECVIRLAFWNVFRPGCCEHYCLHRLREDPDYLPALSYVAEKNGYIEGALYAFKAYLEIGGLAHEVLSFGPLGIDPSFQRQGLGTLLVQKLIEEAAAQGSEAIVVVGWPDYYSRFGFKPGSEFGLTMGEGAANPALQALEIKKGALAGYEGAALREPAAMEVPDPYDLHMFDRNFPHLDKKDPSEESD